MRNLFVVLEGTHCVGKTALAQMLSKRFGFYSVRTPPSVYDPLRDYMHREATGISRFLFYMAGNADASREIQQALKTQPVVCDRYLASTIAACHIDYGVELPRLQSIVEAMGDALVRPDKVFFLRASMEERSKRLKPKLEQLQPYERRIALLEETHLAIMDPHTWTIIDTTSYSIEKVLQLILASIGRCL